MEASSYDSGLAGIADSTVATASPRPSSPAEHPLVASPFTTSGTAESHLPEETGLLQEDGQENGYNSSASSTHQSSSDSLRRDLDDDELVHLNSRASSRSSVSSIPASVPASVLIHPPNKIKSSVATGTHDPFTYPWTSDGNTSYGKPEWLGSPMQTLRQREAAFRKPSSVRAMQMNTEDEDDEYLTPPRRRGGQRNSDISMRSAGSPLKRSPYYSPSGSGSKNKVKKEYPLVLLHCSLLPPSLPLPNGVSVPSQKFLKEILPPPYWRRWRLLAEKVGSGVVRDRGVLISHPQDMYDLLEERLLESLELQRPRVDKGHFLGQETDSEKEDYSGKEESATDDEQGEQCPDCGGRVVRGSHSDRKWEVRVFAANGLMRAGAWAAAWKEMEKVDVEVSLWLPSDVRREFERRLLEDERLACADGSQVSQEKEPETCRRDSRMNDFDEPVQHFQESLPAEQGTKPQERPESATSTYNEHPGQEVDLPTLLINYVRVLASDRRNIAISILSAVVLLLAIGGRTQMPGTDLRPFPQEAFDHRTTTSVDMAHHSALSSEGLASPTLHGPETSASVADSAETTELAPLSTSETSSDAITTPMVEEPDLSVKPLEPLGEPVEPVEGPIFPEPMDVEPVDREPASLEATDPEAADLGDTDSGEAGPEDIGRNPANGQD